MRSAVVSLFVDCVFLEMSEEQNSILTAAFDRLLRTNLINKTIRLLHQPHLFRHLRSQIRLSKPALLQNLFVKDANNKLGTLW